jgi:hypothetical protein
MNLLDRLFAITYCAVREDKNKDRHKRTVFMIEGMFTFFLFSLIMIIVGTLDLRVVSYLIWALLIIPVVLLSYFYLRRYFFKSDHYLDIVKVTCQYSKRKKRFYAFIAIFLFILAGVQTIGGGMLMSYLLSLH